MTQRFKRMCQIYKIFAEPWECDLSKTAWFKDFSYVIAQWRKQILCL